MLPISGVVTQNYEYYADGRLSFVHNTTDNNFDRAFSYDHLKRVTRAKSGGAARNDAGAVPMDESFSYDTFDNITQRETATWLDDYSDAATYSNHRRVGWGYDANGSIGSFDTRSYTYDAAGRNTFLSGQRWVGSSYVSTTTATGFDGQGNRVREELAGYTSIIRYYLRSTVLGEAVVEELNSSGQKQVGYVYTPSGKTVATQYVDQNYVMMSQVSPIGSSQYEFFVSNSGTGSDTRREFDPLGAAVRLNSGPTGHSGQHGDLSDSGATIGTRFGAIDNPAGGCEMDLVSVPCSFAFRLLSQGVAKQCPENDCGPQARWVITEGDDGPIQVPFLTLPFMAFANGESNYYVPGIGVSPQAQADAAGYIRGLAADGVSGLRIDSSQALPFLPQNQLPPELSPIQFLKKIHAFGDAADAIQRDRACLNFFVSHSGSSKEVLLTILQALSNSAQYAPNDESDAFTKNQGTRQDATITLTGFFFSDDTQRIYTWDPKINRWVDDYSLVSRQHRAMTILHEFAHALGIIPRDGSSAPNPNQSELNNDTIYNNCYRGLSRIPGRYAEY